MDNKYLTWLESAKDDAEIYNELISIKNNETEIFDRFYRDLAFGTGGLRGIIGAGTNRMNAYSVGRAAMGLGKYINKNGIKKSVAIAYDSRNKSYDFAIRSAEILSSLGIHAYVFDKLTPTPILSYAVRSLKAGAGIVITASHNPKEYNGFKVYNENGCQITDDAAEKILEEINSSNYFEKFAKNSDYIHFIGDNILNQYLDEIQKLSLFNECDKYAPKIVYTPLHGTGNIPVKKILERQGISNLFIVSEQELPDGNFETCPYPNPEERETLNLAIRDAKKICADLIIATDPDADRVGIAVQDEKGDYRLLNGNETGLLLFDYMLKRKSELGILGKNPTIIKTIVSSDMAFAIANKNGASVKEVLTGFKYIGEAMDKTDNFLMGMEESYGYLVGKHARDKDAVSAVMMIAEMYSYCKKNNTTLYTRLNELYKEYGYYLTDLTSKTYPGAKGAEEMKIIIERIRKNPNITVCGESMRYTDFSIGVDGLPKSNVLRFSNEDIRIIIRPSGTEPKLKIYYQIRAKDNASAFDKLNKVKLETERILSSK